MTDTQIGMLVLQDNTGDYFLLPQTTLEQGRVPAEHKAAVERLLGEAKGGDVSGHMAVRIEKVVSSVDTGADASLTPVSGLISAILDTMKHLAGRGV
ncbi:MAG: hypothetical protein ACRDJ9_34845 [Dehalococcoidia bacterium]